MTENTANGEEREGTYEKALWAHRGLGHAHESAKYRTESRLRQVDRADQRWDFLESHVIPGVMLCGLSIVHGKITGRKEKEKNRPSEQVKS